MCFQEGLKGQKSTRYIRKDLFIRALQNQTATVLTVARLSHTS